MADVKMKNYMEVCVADMVEKVLPTLNCCSCDICKMDITAIALNHLPPKYVVNKKGQLYTKLSALQQQFDVDIISELTKAATMVAKNPRH